MTRHVSEEAPRISTSEIGHYEKLLKELQHVALLFPEEIGFLFEQARRSAGSQGAIVDIGTFKGGSAIALALGIQAAAGADLVHTIDAFESHPLFPAEGLWGTDGLVYRELLSNLKRFGVADRVRGIVGDCGDVAQDWNAPVKLLFYDASVMHDKVTLDIKAWHPFIMKNGLMIFHDYSDFASYTGEVKRAVDEFVGENHAFQFVLRFAETAVVQRV